MARHNSLIQLSGKVGDLIFTQKNGRGNVRSKSTKPVNQTEASKKSSADFGAATSAAAKIRKAFSTLILSYGDENLINRLNTELITVYKTIPKTFSGNKKLLQGNVKLVTGFRFNKSKELNTLLRGTSVFTVLPSQMTIELNERPPKPLVNPVGSATAAVIELGIYNMDLTNNNDQIVSINPLIHRINNPFKGAKLNIPLNLSDYRAVIVAMGIHYLDSSNKVIENKRKRAAGLVFASILKDGVEVQFVTEEPAEIEIEKQPEGLNWELG